MTKAKSDIYQENYKNYVNINKREESGASGGAQAMTQEMTQVILK